MPYRARVIIHLSQRITTELFFQTWF